MNKARAVALMMVVAIVLAACGGNAADTTTTARSDDANTTAPAADATTSDDTTPPADAEPLLIGVSQPLSGPAAQNGTQARWGVEMATEDINANGGILGQPVELVIRDDKCDATTGSQVTRELIDAVGVQALVGSLCSGVIGAQMEITGNAGMIQFVQGVLPAVGDATANPYVFRTTSPAFLQTEALIVFLNDAGLTNPGALAVNDALGTSSLETFEANVEGSGITIAASELHETGQVDLVANVQNLKNAGADSMVVFNTGTDQAAAIRARNELGWDVPVVGLQTMTDPAVAEAVGSEGMEMVFAGPSYPALLRGEGLSEPSLVTRAKEYLGEDPLSEDVTLSGLTYDALMLYAEAAEATGGLDADAIKEYLEDSPPDGHPGIIANYFYDAERHDGITLEDMTYVVAASFENGTFLSALQSLNG